MIKLRVGVLPGNVIMVWGAAEECIRIQGCSAVIRRLAFCFRFYRGTGCKE